MPASHRAASCTANVPFPLRPRTLPPLQRPPPPLPPPGPTGPVAPVCDRGLLPDLALSFALSPAQKKFCGGDPPKKKKKPTLPRCGSVLFVYNCPPERRHLGTGGSERTGVNGEWAESRYDWKGGEKKNHLSKCYKASNHVSILEIHTGTFETVR